MKNDFACAATAAALILATATTSALAGDKPLTGPIPAWVRPAPDLSSNSLSASTSQLPLFDEQVLIDGGTVTGYFDTALIMSSPEVLNRAGTISLPWQPAHGDITFHRLEILRGAQRIDVLKGGSDITVLRREAGLEQKMLDGRLTAIQHVEGLQVGDVLRMTFSISDTDEILRGNIQDGVLLLPAPIQVQFGRARIVWPAGRDIQWKALMPGVTAVPQDIEENRRELVFHIPVVKLPDMPKNYPTRFKPVPLVMFTSFKDWTEIKSVMAPLFKPENTIPTGSDLAAHVDAIAARSADPIHRMADALQLVQDDVRYQLIALGKGNYVPQAPADTWAKRYGDCKAKTLLLLAVLDRLGVKAEPVLANISNADAVKEMPPSPGAFDHVFVRAEVDGVSYWLDGTQLGSRVADINDVPFYGTVLPLFSAGTGLVDLPRRAHARADIDINLDYDMSAGPHFPSPFHLVLSFSGPYGASKRIDGAADVEERLKTFAEKQAKQWVGSDDIGKPLASYDKTNAVWTVQMDGVGYPDWQVQDGRQQLSIKPGITVDSDWSRGRAAWQKIPAIIPDPWTAHSHTVVKLPDGGRDVSMNGDAEGKLSLPAVEWGRTLTNSSGVVIEDVTSRESGIEIAPEDISATHKTISDAMAKTAHLAFPASYPQRWDDALRMRSAPATLKVKATYDMRIVDKPDDAGRLADRAWFETRLLDFAAAEADYGKAIGLDGSTKRYLDRAGIRSKRGDHPGALSDAQAAYNLEPGDTKARAWLATELTYAGKPDDALNLLNADPDVATDDGMSDFLERMDIDELAGRFEEAVEALDAALTKHPRMAKLLNSRCWVKALGASDLDGALADCNRAIELSDDPATYLDSRGMVHFRAGRLQAALDDYNAALEADPEITSSLFMSGIVLNRLGRPAKGAERLRAARALYPNIDQFYARFDIKP